ncbi:MAG: ABC transporter ATP-binding protein [Anaerolineales bacterium]|nr:ABC transporter ATP-binding protein [Anaerolineales bacterium]MCS7249197.1 ABC transporter ATP-binding protein [Anaerolineales bacterium]MDW8163010.1 ABC transporter ATP-binding protein [Anaerolineales bacterium]MDW8446097.1 ABC transporter ATP-binding protein [Anaerolineales bacterium]
MSREVPILEVKDLTVAYRIGDHWLEAIRDVNLTLHAGQIYGLVGESGSGKTTLAMAILNYLGENGKIRKGSIVFEGEEISSLSKEAMRSYWGRKIALVPQNPLSSLNPTLPVGEQVQEVLRYHLKMPSAVAHQRVLELFERVRLADPERVARSYPHQISGGMQQRVMIAMALATSPRLLLLDEPTTSLDVTTQASILDLIKELIQGQEMAVLYVTHNLGVVVELCHRVAVLYAGELVEDAPLEDLFSQPLHPYTYGLLKSVPKLGQNKREQVLSAIPGRIPALAQRGSGCIFRARCPLAIEACSVRPSLEQVNGQRSTRCHRWQEIAHQEIELSHLFEGEEAFQEPVSIRKQAEASALDAEGIVVEFDTHQSLIESIFSHRKRKIKAVKDVSIHIQPGETLGLVGESGSGKTSLARAISGLNEPEAGSIRIYGLPASPKLSKRNREVLRRLQMVFQNPEEALNPFMTVGESLRRQLFVLQGIRGEEAQRAAEEMVRAVQLPVEVLNRRPNQLSGGEKQRIAIARAFITNPDVIIADEPVSSLDVSVQAAILNLINRLQGTFNNGLLFISHDLAVVGYLADQIAVIYLGALMQLCRAADLFEPPYHPYTEALLSAVPSVELEKKGQTIRLQGDLPSPSEPITGCPFHSRCPRKIGAICEREAPPWRVDERTQKRIYCHYTLEELVQLQAPI